jgi:sec-independent protein translocase protein TatC
MTVTAIRSITHTSFRRISNSSNIVRNNYKNGRKLNAAAAYRKRKISEIPRATSSSSPPPSSDANGEGGEGQKQMLESAMDGAGESSATTSTNTFKTSITEDPNFLRGLESSTSSSSSSTSQSQPSSSPLSSAALSLPDEQTQKETVRSFLYPGEEELPDDVEMSIWEHLEELRDRALVSSGAVAACILLCFCFAKDLVIFLEKPVSDMGVRFLQLGPGEYFFTTVKVAGYTGILLAAPVVLYEIIAYVLPGLTKNERKVLGPIVLGSSVLFYIGIYFAYLILTPAALKFFVGYADGAVESLWSIDQYFEFVLVLLFSTGLSFQVPVIQLLLGQTGIVSSKQMLSAWKFVIVGSVVAAAVLTPSTDPFTQMLLAIPLMSLYFGGAALVGVVEREREIESSS